MSLIRAVNAIVETQPARPVSQRAPASQTNADHRRDHSKEQEQQEANPAALLAQQAYQQQVHQDPAPKQGLLAQDLMTAPVTWLPSDSTLQEAWTVMKCKGIHHLPVTSLHGALVGLISDRDLLPYTQELESSSQPGPSAKHTLAQVMSLRVLSASPTTELREIARAMLDEYVSAIPIVDNARHPIGILTTSDILHAIVHRGPLELWT
ncbi:MAG: CBS domain-containing protein [Nitrospirae bacterium]|nr:CBS domain-containing protein [Nitrospirota bacterium]